MIRKLATGMVVAGALSLGGCAGLTKFFDTPIPTGKLEALVPTGAALITTSDAYVSICKPKAADRNAFAKKACDDNLINTKIIPYTDKLVAAETSAQDWIKANNGKTFAPANIYNALKLAITQIQNLSIPKVK